MKLRPVQDYGSSTADLLAECEREARDGVVDATIANLDRLPIHEFVRLLELAEKAWGNR